VRPGDLYRRKLLPAIYELVEQYDLVDRCILLGVATSDLDDSGFREMSAQALKDAGHGDVTCATWCERVLHYEQADVSSSTYEALARRVAALDAAHDLGGNRTFYLALPPTAFTPVLSALDEAGLASSTGWTRLVVEKPFGRDLESAIALNAAIHEHFDEQQIYRIDHYLGKATVQNLLVFRFANSLFESAWHRERIDNVQITVAEDLGIGSRARYYERAGAVRDMVQSHLTQVLSLVAMEPSASFEAEAIRDEKVKVLHAVRPLEAGDLVCGQYGGGTIGDEAVVAYVDEDAVAPDSSTETYVALRLFIDNRRWQGVPFYLRTGKRLATHLTQIAVTFREPRWPRSGPSSTERPSRAMCSTSRFSRTRGSICFLTSRHPPTCRGSRRCRWISTTKRHSVSFPGRTRRCCTT